MKADKQLPFQITLLQIFDTIDSTYDTLQGMANEDSTLPSGVCIDALYQSKGRGQRGNGWFASKGANLLPSFMLKGTSLDAREGIRISDWIALSVAEVVAEWAEGHTPEGFKRSTSSNVKVKWPNDIYWKNKKIAGILIAHTLQMDKIASSFCGIGLNVNETDFPKELPNPIALCEITGKSLPLEQVRQSLFTALERNYSSSLVNKNGASAMHQYYETKLYQRGVQATYYDVQRKCFFEGIIEGVSPEGRLLLRDSADDKLYRYAFKEVVYG